MASSRPLPRSLPPSLASSLRAVLAAAALLPASPAGALVITEIMYHPPEADDRPYEFLEIYNETADPFDLSGHTICDGPDFEFPPGTWLEGKSFLVVCAKEANVRAKYSITNTIGDWFTDPATSPSLSNGGERVSICNPGGKAIVTVRYNDRGKWESGADGTGHSLEIESPFKEVDDPDTWDLSNDIGGSPGLPNPCWPEDEGGGPPTGGGPVGSFTDHRDVGFPCSPGDTTFASGTGRYTISGSGLDIWQGGDQFHFAYVKVRGDFEMRAHIVSRAWSTDRWGKGGIMARQDLTASARYAFVHDNPNPDGARMAIRPTHGGADNAEPAVLADGTHPTWYRLRRVGNTISGFHSTNGTSWTELNDAGTALPMSWAGGTDVYLGFALTSHSNCGVATLVWDQLTLTGTILPPDPGGPGPGPEPGVCTARAEVRIHEAYLRVDPGDERWIELHNKGSTSVNLTGYFLTDDPSNRAKWPIPGGTSIAPGGHAVFTEAQTGFDLAVAAAGDQRFLALVEPGPANRVVDAYVFEPEFQGYSEARVPNDDQAFSPAADPTRGAPNVVSVNEDVVLNEIMYHTIDNDNRKEYVELHNKGSVAHDLTGWRMSDGIDFDIPPGTVIPAGGYLVIARDPTLFTGPASIYGLPAGRVLSPSTQAAIDRFGGLRNRGERVTLSDQLERTVDTLRYHDGGEWPRWADGFGSSLELIDASQDNRRGQAWDASDDSSKAVTQTFSYVARHGNRDTELAIALLARGITVVDDISVIGGGVTRDDTPLVDEGETWRYLKGTAAPPAGWMNQGFSDGGWLSGPTGIGYGDNDDATVLTDMQNGYMTIFCRKTFTVADRTAIDELIFSVVIDDGFYVYLNGTQVGSFNVTSPAFDSPAPSAGEPQTVEIELSAFKGLLSNGTNTLAVQVHNAGLGSSDLSFIPRLVDRTTTITGGTEQLANGHFNSGTTGWVIEGTHIRSGRTTQSPIAGAGSLKIIASARGDNKVNRIETPTAAGTGMAVLTADQDVQISFKTRWVVGSQTILTNGFDHEMARAHALDVPQDMGTPGTRNQVTQRLIAQTGGSNLGPVIDDVAQDPAVPAAGEAVTVRARVLDSDGVSSVSLRYALSNPSASPTAVTMTRVSGTDVWQGTIPGQAQATRVVYFIAATDAGGRTGRYPADVTTRTHPLLVNPPAAGLNDHRYCIYRHDVKNPATNYQNYRFWMTQASQDELNSRRRLSNDPLDGSFVFGGSTIYY
ncbi:MAG: lamin tail domain-containing protein, partial [Planctomycetes bacterium]|nr:lamin tail domain-containing protein [Planctomycetota bacterium]